MAFSKPGGFKENGNAAGIVGGFGVLPFLANNEAAVEVEIVFEFGFANEAGLGFAAGAIVHLVVRAHEDVVERKLLAQDDVHEVEFAPGEVAAGDSGLVRDGQKQEAGGLQLLEGSKRRRVDVKVVQSAGTDLLAAFDTGQIQNAISFEEYRGLHIWSFSRREANIAGPSFSAVFRTSCVGRAVAFLRALKGQSQWREFPLQLQLTLLGYRRQWRFSLGSSL